MKKLVILLALLAIGCGQLDPKDDYPTSAVGKVRHPLEKIKAHIKSEYSKGKQSYTVVDENVIDATSTYHDKDGSHDYNIRFRLTTSGDEVIIKSSNDISANKEHARTVATGTVEIIQLLPQIEASEK